MGTEEGSRYEVGSEEGHVRCMMAKTNGLARLSLSGAKLVLKAGTKKSMAYSVAKRVSHK